MNDLCKTLRRGYSSGHVRCLAANEIERLTDQCIAEGRIVRKCNEEIERLQEELENERAKGIHSCHSKCRRPLCVANREIERLRAALEREQAYTAHLLGECPPDCKNCGE